MKNADALCEGDDSEVAVDRERQSEEGRLDIMLFALPLEETLELDH